MASDILEHKLCAVSALILGAMLIAGCSPVSKFHRFFLAEDCAAGGPVKETEYDLVLRDVSLDAYYQDLLEAAPEAPFTSLDEIPAQSEPLPIYLIGPVGADDGARILLVAGVHGNEVAGALAVPQILAMHGTPTAPPVALYVVTPANPVGIVQQSRFNASGCDINRDFGPFRTREARAIAAALERVEPDVVVSLHEGPGDGLFVIATRSAPPGSAEAMVAAVDRAGLDVSSVDHLGRNTDDRGIMHEGWFVTFGKRVLGIDSLGAYGHERGLGTLTVETQWDAPDVDGRVAAQVEAVRGLIEFMAR